MGILRSPLECKESEIVWRRRCEAPAAEEVGARTVAGAGGDGRGRTKGGTGEGDVPQTIVCFP